MDSRGPAGERPVRILVADGRGWLRRALAALLETYPEIDVVGYAGDDAELLASTRELRPDVVLIDAGEGLDAELAAVGEIKRHPPVPRIVLLAIDERAAARARASGADEVPLVGCPTSELIDAIRGPSRFAPIGSRILHRRFKEGEES